MGAPKRRRAELRPGGRATPKADQYAAHAAAWLAKREAGKVSDRYRAYCKSGNRHVNGRTLSGDLDRLFVLTGDQRFKDAAAVIREYRLHQGKPADQIKKLRTVFGPRPDDMLCDRNTGIEFMYMAERKAKSERTVFSARSAAAQIIAELAYPVPSTWSFDTAVRDLCRAFAARPFG